MYNTEQTQLVVSQKLSSQDRGGGSSSELGGGGGGGGARFKSYVRVRYAICQALNKEVGLQY